MIKNIRRSKSARIAHIIDNGVDKVVPGLSVSPTQMALMAAKGIPISAQMSESFVDGVSNPSFDIPIEDQRGIDVNAVWNAQKDARKRLIAAHKADKEAYD
ncbi:MAG: hypothetical protein K2G41_01200 [Duncaniella sp.]|uniref:hypothetical protein n=1 Tax=Duncaniella sp. TaxID=2518496 RepID=UPI0023D4C8C9|nr:hypothetical protein [Duncaniella sp.]MDE6089294.1 hypothetical protein [Duncaniella sp.]